MRWCLVVAALVLGIPNAGAEDMGYKPRSGFVPDAATAVEIARAVLIPIYGKKMIESEEPLVASRQRDVWTVHGTLRCAPNCLGGTAEIKLSATDARVLHVTHYK
jgi:hypothetical protein